MSTSHPDRCLHTRHLLSTHTKMWPSDFQIRTQLTGEFKKHVSRTTCGSNCNMNLTSLILTMMAISQRRSFTFSSEMRSKFMMKKFDIKWSTKYLTKLILTTMAKSRLKNSSWNTSIPATNFLSDRRKSCEISSIMPDSKMKSSSSLRMLWRLKETSWPRWASAVTQNSRCISSTPKT